MFCLTRPHNDCGGTGKVRLLLVYISWPLVEVQHGKNGKKINPRDSGKSCPSKIFFFLYKRDFFDEFETLFFCFLFFFTV